MEVFHKPSQHQKPQQSSSNSSSCSSLDKQQGLSHDLKLLDAARSLPQAQSAAPTTIKAPQKTTNMQDQDMSDSSQDSKSTTSTKASSQDQSNFPKPSPQFERLLSSPDINQAQSQSLQILVNQLQLQVFKGCNKAICFNPFCRRNWFRAGAFRFNDSTEVLKNIDFEIALQVIRCPHRKQLICASNHDASLENEIKDIRVLGVKIYRGKALTNKARDRVPIRNLIQNYFHKAGLTLPNEQTRTQLEDAYYMNGFELEMFENEIKTLDTPVVRKRINDQVLNYAKLLVVPNFSKDSLLFGFQLSAFRAHLQVLGGWKDLYRYENLIIARQLLLNLCEVLRLFGELYSSPAGSQKASISQYWPSFYPVLFVASTFKPEEGKHVVDFLKQFIVGFIRVGDVIDRQSSNWPEAKKQAYRQESIVAALEAMKLFYDANAIRPRNKTSVEYFVIGTLSIADFVDARVLAKHINDEACIILNEGGVDYINLNRYGFTKTEELKKRIQGIIEEEERHSQMKGNLSDGDAKMEDEEGDVTDIKIDRSKFFKMASACLVTAFSKRMLNLPLKIQYDSEMGIDEGGLTKDFLDTFIREIFTYKDLFFFNPDKQLYYPNGFSSHWMEHAVSMGAATALAYLEEVPLLLQMPRAFFKILFNEVLTLDDLQEMYPELATGFENLLSYDGEQPLEEILLQTFTITLSLPKGDSKTLPLVEGGDKKLLTKDNIQEYIDLYIDFFFRQQARSQLTMFKTGFEGTLTQRKKSLKDVDIDSLIVLLSGNRGDSGHFLKCIHLDDSLSKESICVQHFVNFIKGTSKEECQAVTRFITGASDLPVVPDPEYIQISQMRPELKKPQEKEPVYFPMSSTCTNTLYLQENPEQSQEEFNSLMATALKSDNEGFHRG